ncbi:hypothetical protein BK816_07630 [Boudabousia tangfeifanii]|uniref:DUF3180 domain-containing protein n=1 Tax=Boudabousia tangfeifanii TaxID=1912795 RepID=A0A1D9MLW7_9ACTO|nr:DUF3180 family protein [Boudabousia tangfeifanii]AOZ73179.1 hypothetical protein BK816_07630 [Boudabousia tangfeifanii]
MNRLNYTLMGLLGVLGLVGGWVVLDLTVRSGNTPFIASPLIGVVFAATAVFLYIQGRRVLKLKRRVYTDLTWEGAFKVAVMTHSAGYLSSLFTGALLSQLVMGIIRWEAWALRANAIGAIFGLVGAIALVIVSIIVERWCVIDDDSKPDKGEVSESMQIPRRATPRTKP